MGSLFDHSQLFQALSRIILKLENFNSEEGSYHPSPETVAEIIEELEKIRLSLPFILQSEDQELEDQEEPD